MSPLLKRADPNPQKPPMVCDQIKTRPVSKTVQLGVCFLGQRLLSRERGR